MLFSTRHSLFFQKCGVSVYDPQYFEAKNNVKAFNVCKSSSFTMFRVQTVYTFTSFNYFATNKMIRTLVLISW